MIRLLYLWVFVLITSGTYAQSDLFGYENFVNRDGDTLPYRILISDYDTSSVYPLVVFLHGSGERGTDNETQLKWGVLNFASDEVMKNYRPIVIAPQMNNNERWDNFSDELKFQETPSRPMSLLRELIDQMVQTLPIDESRIYITGLSMGGYGTFDAVMRYPDLFAAAVPVCGAGDASRATVISHIPIWIFHGASDDVVPVTFAHDMLFALTDAGAKPGYTQYPLAGHFSWVAAYDDDMLMPWMFSQHKR